MNEILQWVKKVLSLDYYVEAQVIVSLAIIFIFWFIKIVLHRVIFDFVKENKSRYRFRKIANYLSAALVIIIIGKIWFEGFTQFLGFLSAGLAIALKEPITNIFGWFFIIMRRPFEVGDRIQIGSDAGDVIDIRMFEFTIMEIGNWVNSDQSTGRMIHIPNGKIFSETLANYNRGFEYIWNEIEVLVTFESDWQRAKEILLDIANKRNENLTKTAKNNLNEASKKYMIFYSTLTPIVYTTVKDSGILLTIRYLCKPQRRRGSTNRIWEDILKAFDKCSDIDFAYPTYRLINNEKERQSMSNCGVKNEIRN